MSKMLGTALRSARERKNLSAKAVGAHVGISGPAVSQWEAGKTEPPFARLKKIASFLDLDLAELVSLSDQEELSDEMQIRRDRAPTPEPNVRPAPDAPPYSALQGLARDVPVLGTAVGGEDGDFRLNGEETDRAVRPAALANVKGLFALYVTSDSMYPAWKENALFYVNPNKNPAIGDDVVIEMLPHEEGEPGKAYLKRLKARTPTKYVVEQFNPPKELSFERNEVRIYRVVPWEEALGLS